MPKPSFLMNVLGDERLQETAVRVEKVLQEAIDEVAASLMYLLFYLTPLYRGVLFFLAEGFRGTTAGSSSSN